MLRQVRRDFQQSNQLQNSRAATISMELRSFSQLPIQEMVNQGVVSVLCNEFPMEVLLTRISDLRTRTLY